ncbi:MAG: hypothetical protein SFT94_07525 [Pseudanabaenaceae cyanobacterium bins.68]|nr:hypothetical protein [Pseudanabaenaceae cyanobacterium bins.68]
MSSDLLAKLQAHVRQTQTQYQRHLVRSPEYEEKAGFDPSQFKLSAAQLLEPAMIATPVGQGEISGNQFGYFMDGIQRSWMLYAQNYCPVYYGYVGAVIRARDQGMLTTWRYQSDEGLYLSFNQFQTEELTQLEALGIQLHDLKISEPQFNLQKEKAVERITKQRSRLEADLIKTWIKSNCQQWLVVDGSLSISQLGAEHPRLVGLIKSHNTQYFPFPEQEVILQLKFGDRSSLFQPKGRYPLSSWYLRMRDHSQQDQYFGLIRVEVAHQSAGLANQISQWLLTERRPLSLPDQRWDKMIYPIRDCEQFLRAKEPTRASFGWLG